MYWHTKHSVGFLTDPFLGLDPRQSAPLFTASSGCCCDRGRGLPSATMICPIRDLPYLPSSRCSLCRTRWMTGAEMMLNAAMKKRLA